jgi:hypothetical protein
MCQLHCHGPAIFLNRRNNAFQRVHHSIGIDAHLPGPGLTFQHHMGMPRNNEPDLSFGKNSHAIEQRLFCPSVKICHCFIGGRPDKPIFQSHAVYNSGFK